MTPDKAYAALAAARCGNRDWPSPSSPFGQACLAALAGVLRGEPRKKQAELTDEEWVAELEQEPSLKGINIKQEIGRAQFWAKQNKRVATRRFLMNWLMKAERVIDLKALGAQHATGLRPPPPAGPEGWREWLETELSMLSPDVEGHSQLTAAFLNRKFDMLPQSWQAKCRHAKLQHT